MSLTSDLININSLARSDTFNNWLIKTNEVIQYLNPLQVYEVETGLSGGLLKQTGISAGNYNGVVTLSVNPGPGIGTTNLYGGVTKTIIDYTQFDVYGLTLSGTLAVSSLDEYIINDVSDTALGPNGTVKKIRASKILPYSIDDDHEFGGNIIVLGNLSVLGQNTFIGANNLRIEDKQIELAYQRGVALNLTGVTAGSYTAGNFGATAYYFTDNVGLTAYLSAQFNSYTGTVAGPTGIFYIGSPFSDPYDADDLFGLTGYISLQSTGSSRSSIVSIGTPYNDFLSNNELSEGGIVLKGSESDKQFIWINNDPDTGLNYNAWISNVGIGLSGAWDPYIGRIHRSYGYDGVTGYTGDNFIFAARTNEYLQIQLTELPIGATNNGQFSGGWVISKVPDNLSDQNTLKVWYSDTNIVDGKNLAFSVYGSISAAGGTGENWRAYSGITTTSFAKGLNVDQLDGAHGYTYSSPYSIPISDSYGLISGDLLESSTLRRRVTQSSHGLTFGDIVRIDTNGDYVKALADAPGNAETIGIVSSVSGDSFVITMKGLIRGLSGSVNTVEGVPFSAGEVYFLSGNVDGKLISDPDLAALTRISSGGVRKPILIASSETEGYVVNYIGTVIEDATDELYLSGLVPIGTIYPYAGGLEYLSTEWLVCDGSKYNTASYSDLERVLQDKYFIKVTFSGTTTCVCTDGSRNLEVGDNITLTNTAGVEESRTISAITSTTITVSGSAPVSGVYELRIVSNSSSVSQFFVPDLRSRYIRGKSSDLDIGDVSGITAVTLSNGNLPSHSHGLDISTAAFGVGQAVATGSGSDTNTSATGNNEPFSIEPRNVVTYFIIRARSSTKATILTGHNHDLRYIRYDATHGSVDGLTDGGRATFRENAYVAGIGLGSSLPTFGATHDHDLRYVRFDGSQTLSSAQAYTARSNIISSSYAEGNGYTVSSLTHNHDSIYVRYDGTPQYISPTNLDAFRDKIEVYSKTETDDNYVDVAGDIMTGDLVLDSANLLMQGGGDLWTKKSNGNTHLFSSPDQGRYEIYASNFKLVDDNNQLFINAITGSGNVENQYQILHKGIPIWDTFVTKASALDSGNSRMETYFFGDMTVWPDGYTGGGDTSPILRGGASGKPVFGIDPVASRAFIMGSLLKADGSRSNTPSLDFYDASNADPFNTPAGTAKITGLTFPTADHHAANKQYVDQSCQPAGNVQTTATSYTISGLTNGTYFVSAFINQTTSSSVSLTATVNAVNYGLGVINAGNPVTFNCVVSGVTSTINIVMDSGTNDPNMRHLTYYRIGL